MEKIYDAIIVTTDADYLRVRGNHDRLFKYLPAEKIIFIGNDRVGKYVEEDNVNGRMGFINENDIIPFDSVHNIVKGILNTDQVPRGITGWYYQQFLKMEYSKWSEHEYYLSWDGDTVPTKSFSMFDKVSGKPYFDLKYEYHEEYFTTMDSMFSGMGKVIGKSFISEHMLFNRDYMKELIRVIEVNAASDGATFYEKILNAIRPGMLTSNSFSEFETYGTFVALRYNDAYRLKDWHSIRYGSVYFKPEEITEDDYKWLGNDFDAISFEKDMDFNRDIAAIFSNPEYREKLTARQIVEAIQDSSTEGMCEKWGDKKEEEKEKEYIDDSPDTSKEDEYQFYFFLGDALAHKNLNQAYLCYENAEFLATDENFKHLVREKKNALLNSGLVTVKRASIIVVSYNERYLMQNCLASIRKYCAPEAYNVVIVDNASTDGVREWLQKQKEITLVLSDENIGFPKGCNEGIRNSDKSDDIFLLNNDTRMTHNALFWLRMGLYEDSKVGATGCVANYCGWDQRIDVSFNLPSEYVDYAKNENIFIQKPYEEKSRLCGFAMLIKREALDKIGFLEEKLSPGFYEDDDISVGLRSIGYRLLICHNSFIYHAGSQSFRKRNDLRDIFEKNHKLLTEKWGYDVLTYSVITKGEEETIGGISKKTEESFRILEIGAGSGNYLTHLKYRFPLAEVYGIESNPIVVRNGISTVPNLCVDWKKDKLPFQEKYFDYIIFNNRFCENFDKDIITNKLKDFLNDDGKIIFSN